MGNKCQNKGTVVNIVLNLNFYKNKQRKTKKNKKACRQNTQVKTKNTKIKN